MEETTVKYIKKVDNFREILKKKLNICLYVAISTEGLGLLFLILFFCFIDYFSLLILFFICLIVGALIYLIAYLYYNKKYLGSFKDEFEIRTIEENFTKYDFYKDRSITLEEIKKSSFINLPEEFKGKDLFYFDAKTFNFISSKIELMYEHEKEKDEHKKDIVRDRYELYFIRYSFKKDSLFYLSLINKNMPGEVIRNNRIGEEVFIDNKEFMENFTIRSNDPLKAKEVLSPVLTKNLLDFIKAFKLDCSFLFDSHFLYVVSNRYNEFMKLNIYKKFDEKVFSSYSNEYLIPILIKDIFSDVL